MNTIRPPAQGESDLISELILQSDCGMLPAMFGPAVGTLLSWLIQRPANAYSAANILVIADASGAIGAMVGSLRAAMHNENLPTAGLLLAWYGPRVIARYPRLARAGRVLRSLGNDDFYLSHIAVLPSRRGHGEGGRLLRGAEERARALGARRIVLDVARDNDGARPFYARMGYEEDSLVRIELGRHGAFSFQRLTRRL
jgi:ribosomal protein S18 acetylase RimI-like enzyme